jgi:hypothetical protein
MLFQYANKIYFLIFLKVTSATSNAGNFASFAQFAFFNLFMSPSYYNSCNRILYVGGVTRL